MRRFLAVALLAFAWQLTSAEPARASCVLLSLEEKARLADVVVSGTIQGGPALRPPREVFVRVSRVLKGQASAIVSVRLGPAIPGQGFPFAGATSVDYLGTPGDHLLYLREVDGIYETNDCSGSHPGPATSDERALFGDGVAPTPATLADEFAALGVLPFIIVIAFIAVVVVAVARLRAHA